MQPYYGFNFQWMYHHQPGLTPQPPHEAALDFMAQFGFNFVRLPTSYRFWVQDFDYFNPQREVWNYFDRYLAACTSRGLHLSLNLHRAPGYCINSNHLERHNLWLDPLAQDAFVFTWQELARRFWGVPASQLSFDLLNEPPEIGQYGLSRANHAALITRTVQAIRQIDPQREIVIDGLGGGHVAMPELANLGVVHSGRGYQPMSVSHYQASWWDGHRELSLPEYPGWYQQTYWNREALWQFYQPWREVEAQGARVHIGEFGCYNQTPNEVALRWFNDLFGVFRQAGWGYALWEFEGAFGIANHQRPGVRYENLHGFQVDRELLDLMLQSRVEA